MESASESALNRNKEEREKIAYKTICTFLHYVYFYAKQKQ